MTVKQWFANVGGDLGYKLRRNITDDVPATSLVDAIRKGFYWSGTPEGGLYWWGVVDGMKHFIPETEG